MCDEHILGGDADHRAGFFISEFFETNTTPVSLETGVAVGNLEVADRPPEHRTEGLDSGSRPFAERENASAPPELSMLINRVSVPLAL